jgi:hypothetical protein
LHPSLQRVEIVCYDHGIVFDEKVSMQKVVLNTAVSMERLSILVLGNVKLDDSFFQLLSFPNLKSLHLRRRHIALSGLDLLVDACPNIEELVLDVIELKGCVAPGKAHVPTRLTNFSAFCVPALQDVEGLLSFLPLLPATTDLSVSAPDDEKGLKRLVAFVGSGALAQLRKLVLHTERTDDADGCMPKRAPTIKIGQLKTVLSSCPLLTRLRLPAPHRVLHQGHKFLEKINRPVWMQSSLPRQRDW